MKQTLEIRDVSFIKYMVLEKLERKGMYGFKCIDTFRKLEGSTDGELIA